MFGTKLDQKTLDNGVLNLFIKTLDDLNTINKVLHNGDFPKDLSTELQGEAAKNTLFIFLTLHAIDTGLVSYEAMLDKIRLTHGTIGAEHLESRVAGFRDEWERLKPTPSAPYNIKASK